MSKVKRVPALALDYKKCYRTKMSWNRHLILPKYTDTGALRSDIDGYEKPHWKPQQQKPTLNNVSSKVKAWHVPCHFISNLDRLPDYGWFLTLISSDLRF